MPLDLLSRCESEAVGIVNGMYMENATLASFDDYMKRISTLDCGLVAVFDMVQGKGLVYSFMLSLANVEAAGVAVTRMVQEVRSYSESTNRKQLQDAQMRKPQL